MAKKPDHTREITGRHARFLREQQKSFFAELAKEGEKFRANIRETGRRAEERIPQQPLAGAIKKAGSIDLATLEQEVAEHYERLGHKGEKVTIESHPRLWSDIQILFKRAAVSPMAVHVIEGNTIDAQAYSRAILLHKGFLEVVDHDEAVAFAAHEIGHMLAGHLPKKPSYIRTSYPKEFEADNIAVHLTGKPRVLIALLEKLAPLEAQAPGLMRLCANLLKGRYPKIEQRIERLKKIEREMETSAYDAEHDFSLWLKHHQRSQSTRNL